MKYLMQTINMKLFFFILFSLLMISACSSPAIEDYRHTSPNFNVLNFFSGELQAKGVVLDRSGLVTRRFSVKMLGTIEKIPQQEIERLILEEWFVFNDGEKTERTWIISKNNDGTYSGRAGDIIGTAQGETKGMALRWDYEMDLTVNGSVYRVLFDDWLYRIDDNHVINRSVIKKWGINVGEVILSITKI